MYLYIYRERERSKFTVYLYRGCMGQRLRPKDCRQSDRPVQASCAATDADATGSSYICMYTYML